MVVIRWPAYMGDHRAGRVERHQWTKRAHPSSDPTRWLYVCGPEGAAAQIRRLADGRAVAVPVPEASARDYSHCFEFANGKVREVTALVQSLETLMTLADKPHLDHALVMDWYKIPPDDPDVRIWPNTPTGDLVNGGKYRHIRSRSLALADAMAEAIMGHPLLREASTIVTSPGHEADGGSYGEQLARAVARRTGHPVTETVCVHGPRAQRKSGEPVDLEGEFAMPHALSGPALIIDDVCRSGSTMSAVGLAARLGGASAVYAFAPVKTMRN